MNKFFKTVLAAVMALAASFAGAANVANWNQFTAAAGNGGSIVLTADITIGGNLTISKNVQISSQGSNKYSLKRGTGFIAKRYQITIQGSGVTATIQNVTVDGQSANNQYSMFILNQGATLRLLSGATIQNVYANAGAYNTVYVNNGAFVMEDGSAITNCRKTGTSGSGGGAVCLVNSTSTFTMNGGTISDCTSTRGGGAVDVESGTFTMNGGTISGCSSSSQSGGAVRMAGGTTTINGGTLSGNSSSSTYGGGAIWLYQSSTLNINGGTISGNSCSDSGATGGAICIYQTTAKVYIKGSPVISGNTKNGVVNNIGLYDANTSSINQSGDLSDSAVIGISYPASGTAEGQQFGITANASYGGAEAFVYDGDAELHGEVNSSRGLIWAYPTPVCRLVSTGKTYSSLDKAFNAAAATDEIQLLMDLPLEFNNQAAISKNLTITSDPGHTYTLTRGGTGCSLAIPSGKTLILKNVVFDGNSLNATVPMFAVQNGGTLTIQDGTTIRNCRNVSSQGGAVSAASGAVVNLAGGTITGCSAANGGAVYLARTSASSLAVLNVSGNPVVTSNYKLDGTTLSNVEPAAGDQIVLNGAFSGSVGVSYPGAGTEADGVQFGRVASGSAADGFSYDANSQIEADILGSTLVWVAPSPTPVCRIGDTTFNTLKKAVNAASDGDTIILMDNIVQKSALTIDKDITITSEEGQVYSITREASSATFAVNGDVALENVIIEGAGVSSAQPMFSVSSGNSLTVKDGTVIRNCISTGNGGAIYNEGTVNLEGGTITDNKATQGGAIYALGAVNVKGNATVTGNTTIAGAANNLVVTTAGQIQITGPFTGEIGVSYPSMVYDDARFGFVGDYVPTSHDARHFSFDGDAAYHGKVLELSPGSYHLAWIDNTVEFPAGGTINSIIANSSSDDDPLVIIITEDASAGNISIPTGRDIIIDLNGHELSANITARGKVTVTDSSEDKLGKLSGSIIESTGGDVTLEWGTYTADILEEWVVADRVILENYDGSKTITVISGESKLENCTLDTRLGVRLVNDPVKDIIPLTYASSNFVYRMSDDYKKNTFVGIAAAYPPRKADGTLTPLTEAEWHNGLVNVNDPAASDRSYDYPLGNYNITHDEFVEVYNGPGEASVVWQEWCWGLVEAIHSNQCGVIRAWYKFPDPVFRVTQRDDTTRDQQKTEGDGTDGNIYWENTKGTDQNRNKYEFELSYDYLEKNFGFNRIGGEMEEHLEMIDKIRDNLDAWSDNGLRVWENIVTGTDPSKPYIADVDPGSTGAPEGTGEGTASTENVVATVPSVNGTKDYYGYDYWYDLRRATNWWNLVGGTRDKNPAKVVPLYAADNDNDRDPTGLYKVFTLIVPDTRKAITNEIPTKNVIGVLKVESVMTNTMVNIPWKSLAHDPAMLLPETVVSNLTKTTNLDPGDRIYFLDGNYKGTDTDATDKDYYQAWVLGDDYKWRSINTIKVNEYGTQSITSALSPEQKQLFRGGGVWVVRDNPTRIDQATGKEVAKPFYIYGQFETNDVSTTINGSSVKDQPVYTMLGIPGIYGLDINNDIEWGNNPIEDTDVITIPTQEDAPLKLRWKVINGVGSWGYTKTTRVYDSKTKRWRSQSVRVTDVKVPRGYAFWYTRRGEPFEFKWKLSWPKAGLEEYFGWEKYPESSKPGYDPPARIE